MYGTKRLFILRLSFRSHTPTSKTCIFPKNKNPDINAKAGTEIWQMPHEHAINTDSAIPVSYLSLISDKYTASECHKITSAAIGNLKKDMIALVLYTLFDKLEFIYFTNNYYIPTIHFNLSVLKIISQTYRKGHPMTSPIKKSNHFSQVQTFSRHSKRTKKII